MEGIMDGIPPHLYEKIKALPKDKRDLFLMSFGQRRKSEGTAMILTALGCLGIGGLGRFYLGSTVLGVVYILTWGLLSFGTLYDLIVLKKLVNEANGKIAQTIISELDMFHDDPPKSK